MENDIDTPKRRCGISWRSGNPGPTKGEGNLCFYHKLYSIEAVDADQKDAL